MLWFKNKIINKIAKIKCNLKINYRRRRETRWVGVRALTPANDMDSIENLEILVVHRQSGYSS